MRVKNKTLNIVLHIFFIIFCILCIIPVLMALSASFSSEGAIVSHGYSILPKEISLDGYKYVFSTGYSILSAYAMTIVTVAAGVIFGVLATAMYGYVISRKDFEHGKFFLIFVFFTQLFNGGMVAAYIINTQALHLTNTPIILMITCAFSSWNVLVLKSFFTSSVPFSIIEAGTIDGANEYKIFFQLVMPISLPGIATIALFITLDKWNDWMTPMLYITDKRLYTLSFLLQSMLTNIQQMLEDAQNSGVASDMEKIPSESARMALCMVALGPMLVIYPFFQKYFIQGMTIGSVKE